MCSREWALWKLVMTALYDALSIGIVNKLPCFIKSTSKKAHGLPSV